MSARKKVMKTWGITGRNIELYSAAYRIAWKQISPFRNASNRISLCVFMRLFGPNSRRERPILPLSHRMRLRLDEK
jgi:hypothetical protein